MIKICKGCQKAFIPTRHKETYCSRQCRTRECPVCGTEFITLTKQKYCSPACGKKVRRGSEKKSRTKSVAAWILKSLADGPACAGDLARDYGRVKQGVMTETCEQLADAGAIVRLGKFNAILQTDTEHDLYGLPGVAYGLTRVKREFKREPGPIAPPAYRRGLSGWGQWK